MHAVPNMLVLSLEGVPVNNDARCSRAARARSVSIRTGALSKFELQLLLWRWRSSRHVQPQFWLRWLLDLGFGFSEALVKEFFKLQGDVIDVATILVVETRVVPNERHVGLEFSPAIVTTLAGRLPASMNALHLLLDGGQRPWFFYEGIVVFQTPTREVDEWRKDW
jgi:hypothetical protein